MYISYSGHKTLRTCLFWYWHKYVNATKVEPDNKVHSLYGSVVGTIFESFYNEKLWRSENIVQTLLDRVESTYDDVVSKETKKGNVFVWNDPKMPSKKKILTEVRETIPRGIEIIRRHRLIGPEVSAEFKLDGFIKGHQVGGRSDFIIRRVAPENDLVILDGKGSKYREMYVDVRQLRWYALLYQERFDRLPDRLGFVYWRSEPDNALDWIEFTPKEINNLKESILESIGVVEQGVRMLEGLTPDTPEHAASLKVAFQARPGECKRCPYSELCPTGKAFLAELKPEEKLSALGVGTHEL